MWFDKLSETSEFQISDINLSGLLRIRSGSPCLEVVLFSFTVPLSVKTGPSSTLRKQSFFFLFVYCIKSGKLFNFLVCTDTAFKVSKLTVSLQALYSVSMIEMGLNF